MVVLVRGCLTTVFPRVKMLGKLDYFENPRLFVVSERWKYSIEETLQDKGLTTVDSQRDADLVVVTTFGEIRGRSNCGIIRNFKLEVVQEGVTRVVITGRLCEDEIVRDSIAELARILRLGREPRCEPCRAAWPS